MTGRLQHYLPASIIGGFGAAHGSSHLRDGLVAVRRFAEGKVYVTRAGNVASACETYRLQNPPPGTDPDIVDDVWHAIEPKLSGMVSRLDAGALDADDPANWLDYVTTVFVRNTDLLSAGVGDANRRRGAPDPTKNDLLVAILCSIRTIRPQVAAMRWRVLHSLPDACRFLITDFGYAGIKDPVYLCYCYWIPVGPCVGLLGYPDCCGLPPRRPPFAEHLVLTPEWARWVAATAFPDVGADDSHRVFPTVACGHPDDKQRLTDAIGTKGLLLSDAGPYRSRLTGTVSLID